MAERRATTDRIVRCPGCGGASIYAVSNPYRPFCSERCRLADLGAWASQGYRVPAAPADQEGEDADPQVPDAG